MAREPELKDMLHPTKAEGRIGVQDFLDGFGDEDWKLRITVMQGQEALNSRRR